MACASAGCKFLVNSDMNNNDGKYCCQMCMNKTATHGPSCEKVLAAATVAIARAAAAMAAVARVRCISAGCTFLTNTNKLNNNGAHCCYACMTTAGTHGSACEQTLAPTWVKNKT